MRAFKINRDAEALSTSILTGTTARSAFPAVAAPLEYLIGRDKAERLTRITRGEAMTVPAVARAVQLYRGIIGTFPLREYVAVPPAPVIPRPFLNNLDPYEPQKHIIADTVDDLICYGVAYWRIIDVTWDGFPKAIQILPADQVSEIEGNDPAFDPIVGVNYAGRNMPISYPTNGKSSPNSVIKFSYGHGVLNYAAHAIRIAAALEDATFRYAENPVPQVALKNNGADLTEEDIEVLLSAWEDARKERSVAYLNSVVDLVNAGFNPEELQMVDARNMAAVQVARAFNLDPVWVGAVQSGSSITYANRVDLYRQLLDLSLQPLMTSIQNRLSMDDVTPQGHAVRFDTSVFLRDDRQSLADFLTKVMPLGLMSVNEARTLLNLLPVDGGDDLAEQGATVDISSEGLA